MRASVILFTLVLLGAVFAVQAPPASAGKQDNQMAPAKTKEMRWQGTLVHLNAKDSNMLVLGGNKESEGAHRERMIVYDSSTQWTKQSKPAEQGEFKEGSFLIVLGYEDDKGQMHATRVDLRKPR